MAFRRRAVSQTVTNEKSDIYSALDKVQAIIWFDIEGNILNANENFLECMGYASGEIQGKHHRMFVYQTDGVGEDPEQLWQRLKHGDVISGEVCFVDKAGKTAWLQACYTPVSGPDGKPAKVALFTIDITKLKTDAADYHGQIEAIQNVNAVIEFNVDGTIRDANQAFLSTVGYELVEIQGKHHSIFVDPEYAASSDYQKFWSDFANGIGRIEECKRVAKGGRVLWLHANYAPIRDATGKVHKVVKFASDITESKDASFDSVGQLEAIGKSQAVIEFDMDGIIQAANENFLSAMGGYELTEIKGKHHSIFVEPEEKQSAAYQDFWEKLRNGEFQTAEYKRIGKNGRVVWIQASYNPIYDASGQPYKVVKYALDVSERKMATNMLEKCLTALAGGDLSARIPDTFSGDFAVVRDAFNATMTRLGDLVGGIHEASRLIADDSQVIASNTNELSTRGERQASTVEETTAAMEEISGTVRSNASNATEASASAKEAAAHAKKGGEVVGSAVSAMGRIEESSAKIGKIIEVIDSIAFQTNLLALNAGVEAARAGDAGRGFAVVASEVRGLAQRASQAAKDINALIDASGREVAEGSNLVNQSGEALTMIVSSVETVVESIGDISTASNEQTSSISEVTQAISEIDATTQQTAALAEESAAAAAELANRANDLRELVSFFRQSSHAPVAASSVAASSLSDAASVVVPSASTPSVQTPVPQAKTLAAALPNTEALADEDWEEF